MSEPYNSVPDTSGRNADKGDLEVNKQLARKMLLQMFGQDSVLIDGWEAKSDVKWLVALGFVAKEVAPLRAQLAKFNECRSHVDCLSRDGKDT